MNTSITFNYNENDRKGLILAKAFFRTSSLLKLTRQEIRDILDLSEPTFSRLINDKNKKISPQSKEGEVALFLLRIYRSLDSFFGRNIDHVKQWFNAPNAHLKGTPREKIKTSGGLIFVADYLDPISTDSSTQTTHPVFFS